MNVKCFNFPIYMITDFGFLILNKKILNLKKDTFKTLKALQMSRLSVLRGAYKNT